MQVIILLISSGNMIRRNCVMINDSHDPQLRTNQEKCDFVLEEVRLKWVDCDLNHTFSYTIINYDAERVSEV